ncbi:hypothetical protein [Streptomyces sp. B6B3]|uniref:hypothetical protein n=1 Tax=Streptomyces sp. B6B3 TaxID=3153570 RepID=UPI00325EBED8
MNRYGVAARAHWQRWLPTRYAALPDPTAYFTVLGEEVEQRVGDLWDDLVDADEAPADETHEQRVGRLGLLKVWAENEVLKELVWLPPEAEAVAADETDDDAGLESDEQFEARTRRLRERTERLAATADALLDGTPRLEDLDDEQLRSLLDYLPPSFPRLLGTSVEELRAHGRDL